MGMRGKHRQRQFRPSQCRSTCWRNSSVSRSRLCVLVHCSIAAPNQSAYSPAAATTQSPDTSALPETACKHMQHMQICAANISQRRAPLPWPTHTRCRAAPLRASQRAQPWPQSGKGRQQEQDDEPEVDLVEELAAAEAAAAATGPPEILEDFSNFTPDPPGHKAGARQCQAAAAYHDRPNATLEAAMCGAGHAHSQPCRLSLLLIPLQALWPSSGGLMRARAR